VGNTYFHTTGVRSVAQEVSQFGVILHDRSQVARQAVGAAVRE
jgi:hypothetical protein